MTYLDIHTLMYKYQGPCQSVIFSLKKDMFINSYILSSFASLIILSSNFISNRTQQKSINIIKYQYQYHNL